MYLHTDQTDNLHFQIPVKNNLLTLYSELRKRFKRICSNTCLRIPLSIRTYLPVYVLYKHCLDF